MKHSLLNNRDIFFIPIVFLLLPIFVFSENSDSTIAAIEANNNHFEKAAFAFDINPAFLKSIVYVERSSNFDWKDKIFDVFFAQSGRNSSIGFCQIKLKTAYWIETQITDTLALYNPGKNYTSLLSVSKSPNELIVKLKVDSINIFYAAAYLKIITSYWKKAGFSIDEKPGIIGTLYSIGLFGVDGKPRKPYAYPKANWFGKKVKDSLSKFIVLFKNTKL